MLDFRYHALSLAAVLLALAVGILIGVAIGDSNLVSSAKNGIVRSLHSEVSAAEREAERLQSRLRRAEAVGQGLYGLAVQRSLTGRQIGLVFLGAPSERVNSLVREAVTAAGGTLSTAVAVREPLQLSLLAARATGTQYTGLGSTPGLVRQFGLRVAVELVEGGPLIDRERTELLSAFDGTFGGLAGVVIERAEPKGMSGLQRAAVAEFQHGLIEGLSSLGVDAVGVELTQTNPSQVPWYAAQRIASVDDLDSIDGRAALDLALAGAQGAFGVKPTAEALLPRVAPQAASSASRAASGAGEATSASHSLTQPVEGTRSAKPGGSAPGRR